MSAELAVNLTLIFVLQYLLSSVWYQYQFYSNSLYWHGVPGTVTQIILDK